VALLKIPVGGFTGGRRVTGGQAGEREGRRKARGWGEKNWGEEKGKRKKGRGGSAG
jgi:hypothetical protein